MVQKSIFFKEMTLSSMQTIEVRGVEYKLVKARDFEVIVRSDNGFINYTKLCQQINDNRRPFSQLKKAETFKRLCIQMEFSAGRIRPAENVTSLYEQIKDHIEITTSGSNNNVDLARVAGTYMPRYLLDYVIMTCDIGYYKLIHELMDTIDQVAQERQVKFVEELRSNIDLQKAKLERKKLKIGRLEQLNRDINARFEQLDRQHQETINELHNVQTQNRETHEQLDETHRQLEHTHEQLDETHRQLEHTHEQLDETHRQLEHTHEQLRVANIRLNAANTKLDNLSGQITSLSDTFTSNFSEMNITTGTAEYVYMILTRPSLTLEARQSKTIAMNYAMFDSICCLKKDKLKQLQTHNFNEKKDTIEIEYECSCSLDISKFISENFNKMYCYNLNTSTYRRKLVYLESQKDKILDKIRIHISRSSRNKESIIERLDKLQDTVNNIEERVARMEDYYVYLHQKGTFIIDGKVVRRVLNRDLYHNLYINYDGNRYRLSIDDLNNAKFE